MPKETKRPESKKPGVSKKLGVTFSVELFPKKEFTDEVRAAAKKPEEGVFAIQELRVGQEDFVVVFGRTHVSYA